MKKKYFQLYWEILHNFTHIPSSNPLRTSRQKSWAHLELQQYSSVNTWWKCWGFYPFYLSTKCTHMCHYVPRSTTDSQTKECIKLYGGSWKYPDLWKTQNRKTDLPLEMMREIVKTWIVIQVHTHRGETLIRQELWGLKSPWWHEGAGYQLIRVAKKVGSVGGLDWMNQQEAWLEKVPQEVWDILVLWTQGIRIIF